MAFYSDYSYRPRRNALESAQDGAQTFPTKPGSQKPAPTLPDLGAMKPAPVGGETPPPSVFGATPPGLSSMLSGLTNSDPTGGYGPEQGGPFGPQKNTPPTPVGGLQPLPPDVPEPVVPGFRLPPPIEPVGGMGPETGPFGPQKLPPGEAPTSSIPQKSWPAPTFKQPEPGRKPVRMKKKGIS